MNRKLFPRVAKAFVLAGCLFGANTALAKDFCVYVLGKISETRPHRVGGLDIGELEGTKTVELTINGMKITPPVNLADFVFYKFPNPLVAPLIKLFAAPQPGTIDRSQAETFILVAVKIREEIIKANIPNTKIGSIKNGYSFTLTADSVEIKSNDAELDVQVKEGDCKGVTGWQTTKQIPFKKDINAVKTLGFTETQVLDNGDLKVCVVVANSSTDQVTIGAIFMMLNWFGPGKLPPLMPPILSKNVAVLKRSISLFDAGPMKGQEFPPGKEFPTATNVLVPAKDPNAGPPDTMGTNPQITIDKKTVLRKYAGGLRRRI